MWSFITSDYYEVVVFFIVSTIQDAPAYETHKSLEDKDAMAHINKLE